MHLKAAVALSILSLIALNGCSLLVGGIVGAAITPLVQPQVDRVLGGMGLESLDPAGVKAVRDFDSGKPE